MKLPYKRPRVTSGDLRTLVRFYEFKENEGPEPGEVYERELYKAYAKIEEVYSRDVELAKRNGTLSDLTITIWDPKGEYIPLTSHRLEVDIPEYSGRIYKIREAQPGPQKRDFLKIIATVTE